MFVIIFVTASDYDEAKNIGKTLVEERLVACANVIRDVHSIYWWKGEIEESGEALLVLKTKREKVAAVAKRVGELHSYENPEVIAVPISEGKKEYLDWVEEEVH
jgi:periplasmic divalent cation tolerance protein